MRELSVILKTTLCLILIGLSSFGMVNSDPYNPHHIVAAARSAPGANQCIASTRIPGLPIQSIIHQIQGDYKVDFINTDKCPPGQGPNCNAQARKILVCVLMDLNLGPKAVDCENILL